MASEPRGRRESFLTIFLVLLAGGLIVFVLTFISFGVFGYVLAAVPVFALVGFLHYVLWGYAMSQETAGEREELLTRDDMDHDDFETRHSVRDLSRHRPPE
jgi:hypothetical protein